MSSECAAALTAIVSSLVGGLTGGGLSILAALKALQSQSRDLEATEIRKQKVECLVAIAGYRFVIVDSQYHSAELKAKLMYQFNKIPILWAGDSEVMKCNRDFFDAQLPERLVKLVRAMGSSTNLQINQLGDTEILNIYRMQ